MAKFPVKLLPITPNSARRLGRSTLFKAGLVCIGCYLGSSFEVVYPRLNTAILFPPYAILTAALLLSPMRHWWIYLVASALGNYLAHRVDFPVSWALLTEAANFSRALLAALGMRWAMPTGIRFDTFRCAVAYLAFGVFIAPLVAAFIGAGVVAHHVDVADFWSIWQAWFLSNALTGLTILPICVIGIRYVAASNRMLDWQRSFELAALFFGLLLAGILVIAGSDSGSSSLPARLYAPLPFLLWAAVRFGPNVTNIAILGITALTIWGALHEHAPFVTQSPAENLLSLQLYLLAVSSPLALLAAVMAERNQAFAALSESEREVRRELAQLATIYKTTPIGLAFVDTQLRYVGVNDRLADFHGLPPEVHSGRSIREVMPKLADHIEPIYRQVLSSGKPVVGVETRSIGQSSAASERSWLSSFYPVKDEQGVIFGVSEVVLETTDQKEAEEARRELAHASRLALVGELTASIAHEINQPLGAILSNADAAEMLLESSAPPLDAVRQILSDIRNDDIRASEVIRRIRTLSRKRVAEAQWLNINEEISEVLKFVNAEASRRGIALEATLAPDLPAIHGGKIQIQQVLLNLLMNGMESMSNAVETRRLSISSYLQDSRTLAVAIADTGIGIEPNQLPHLFQHFYSTKKDGMGLGLSIVRSLIEAHGGSVSAENNVGGGATFRFAIPLQTEVTQQNSPRNENTLSALPR